MVMSFDKEHDLPNITEVEAAHTEQVTEYIKNPRNLRIMRNYDGKGEKTARIGKQLVTVVLYLKVRDDVIQDVSYFSDSLGGLIHAYGSTLTETVKGKIIREALWIRPEDISSSLQLPETGYGDWFKKVLIEAINDYNVYRSAPWKKPYEKRRGF